MGCVTYLPRMAVAPRILASRSPLGNSLKKLPTTTPTQKRIKAGEEPKVNEPAPPSEEATEEEDPVWVRREKLRKLQEEEGVDLPFPFYLIGSGIVAIAAIGSVFEFINKRPVFGVIQTDSPVWLPLLAFFALAGIPVSGILFFRAVESANKAAERSDAIDRM